jgi:hypothetical protein
MWNLTKNAKPVSGEDSLVIYFHPQIGHYIHDGFCRYFPPYDSREGKWFCGDDEMPEPIAWMRPEKLLEFFLVTSAGQPPLENT